MCVSMPKDHVNTSIEAAVQVVGMAATIHMVPPTRASTFFCSQLPLHIMYFYKSSDDNHADVVLDIYPEQNLKYWT